MKILYYELSEKITEAQLLSPLIELGLRKETLLPLFSGNPFFKEQEFDLERLCLPIGNQSAGQAANLAIIQFESALEYFQHANPTGRFASQTVKIIELLIKSRAAVSKISPAGLIPPSGFSVHALQTLMAFTYGLDLLNIGSVYTRTLPLINEKPLENKLVEAVYEICQVEVKPANSTGTIISWTAAAILAVLANFQVPVFRFLQAIHGRVDAADTAASSWRVIVGELEIAEDKAIVLIQTNIDDMSPQLLSHAINKLFQAGALDVFQIPIYMKKNRVGIRLNVVVRQKDEARLANLMLKETSTLGVIVQRMEHNYHAEVRMIEVKTKYGDIPVKQKYLDGDLVQSRPEYEIAAIITSNYGITMEELHNEVMQQIKQTNRQS